MLVAMFSAPSVRIQTSNWLTQPKSRHSLSFILTLLPVACFRIDTHRGCQHPSALRLAEANRRKRRIQKFRILIKNSKISNSPLTYIVVLTLCNSIETWQLWHLLTFFGVVFWPSTRRRRRRSAGAARRSLAKRGEARRSAARRGEARQGQTTIN